jgi:aminopeptidase N
MLRLFRATVAVALAFCVVSAPAFATPGARWWDGHPRDRFVGDEFLRDVRDPIANHRARVDRPNALRGALENCPHDYDVLHYDLTFYELNELANSLDAVTVIDFVSRVDALASIDLDLTSQLTVSSVLLESVTPLAFSHVGDVLNVQFAAPPDSGDTVSIEVSYAGLPWNEGGGGFGGFWSSLTPKNAFSMGVALATDPPSMGRAWFPSWDWPCDKATVTTNIETNFNRVGVSNGILVGKDSTATHHTWRWQHDYPVSTYLIAVSVAKYRELPDSVVTDPRIDVYYHPQVEAEAPVSFQYTDLMMEAFETRFGPYPYDSFKFMTTTKGDMEHQTCVSHLHTLVNGNNNNDDILAHEMAHMWFGDCVTYGDWRDVWLSEGFATYGEAVFTEYQSGTAAYHAYVSNILMGRVLNSGLTDGLYDPSFKWGVESYEKGGSVLHMLRGILDDDALFWQVLLDYRTNFEYGNAVTTDFLASVAATVGDDLSWFFDPWLYGVGHPVYEYGWSWDDLGGGQYRVDVGIRQVQGTGTLFDLPLDFRVHTVSGDEDFSERIALEEETVSFIVSDVPTGLTIDPDDWALDEQQLAPTSADWGPGAASAQALVLQLPRPNPFRQRAEIRYYLPRTGPISLAVHDVSGRRVRTLVEGLEQAGSRTVWWDRRTADGEKVAAGVYYLRLATPEGMRSEKVVVLD